jgi:alkylated DNA repair protein alkB family protein 6
MDSLPQLTSLPTSLEDARIKSLPSSAFYIADFISKEEEQILLNKVSHTPFAPDLC